MVDGVTEYKIIMFPLLTIGRFSYLDGQAMVRYYDLTVARPLRRPGLPPLLGLEHENLVGAGLGAPDLAFAARELAHARVAVG